MSKEAKIRSGNMVLVLTGNSLNGSTNIKQTLAYMAENRKHIKAVVVRAPGLDLMHRLWGEAVANHNVVQPSPITQGNLFKRWRDNIAAPLLEAWQQDGRYIDYPDLTFLNSTIGKCFLSAGRAPAGMRTWSNTAVSAIAHLMGPAFIQILAPEAIWERQDACNSTVPTLGKPVLDHRLKTWHLDNPGKTLVASGDMLSTGLLSGGFEFWPTWSDGLGPLLADFYASTEHEVDHLVYLTGDGYYGLGFYPCTSHRPYSRLPKFDQITRNEWRRGKKRIDVCRLGKNALDTGVLQPDLTLMSRQKVTVQVINLDGDKTNLISIIP